jgi:transposase
MTLETQTLWTIPKQTALVVRASFPKGNIYIKMYEELEELYQEEEFQLICSQCREFALSPVKLALITLMQWCEKLTDTEVANLLPARLDWKYALGLELTEFKNIDPKLLPEWRKQLIKKEAECQLLDKMIARFRDKKLLKDGRVKQMDSTYVLSAIGSLNG